MWSITTTINALEQEIVAKFAQTDLQISNLKKEFVEFKASTEERLSKPAVKIDLKKLVPKK